jgi:hypothetical protein
MLRQGLHALPVAIASLSPITSIVLMIGPHDLVSPSRAADFSGLSRLYATLFSLAATGGYVAVAWWMYTTMVKNFDMTIRRQSR